MRPIVILLLVIVGLAMARMLVRDVSKAVGKAFKSEGGKKPKAAKGDETPKAGRLVRDPETGAYVDETVAVRADIGGKAYFFESEKSRDAFKRKNT